MKLPDRSSVSGKGQFRCVKNPMYCSAVAAAYQNENSQLAKPNQGESKFIPVH